MKLPQNEINRLFFFLFCPCDEVSERVDARKQIKEI